MKVNVIGVIVIYKVLRLSVIFLMYFISLRLKAQIRVLSRLISLVLIK